MKHHTKLDLRPEELMQISGIVKKDISIHVAYYVCGFILAILSVVVSELLRFGLKELVNCAISWMTARKKSMLNQLYGIKDMPNVLEKIKID